MISFTEVIDRAMTGPLMPEKEYDLKVFVPKLRQVSKKYEIRYNPDVAVPADDEFADRLFGAGLELYREVGTYCTDTNRIIQFTADEIREGLVTAPVGPIFGEGKDAKPYPSRRPDSDIPPWCYVGAGGTPVSSEEIFEAYVKATGEIPFGDGVTAPSLANIGGATVRAGTPLEILACIKSTQLTREGLRRAGRPGMPVQNSIATAVSDAGKIAGSQFGMRPSDGWLVGALAEMKVSWERLNEVAYVTSLGGHVVAETCPMVGGYCGGPAGMAIANVAYHIQSILVFRGSYHLNFSIDLQSSCSTGRQVIWGTGASAQAITRNSHFPLQTSGLVASGPGTEMQPYEAAAAVIAHVASGSSVGPTGGSPGNATMDNITPMNGRWSAQVAHAVVGMKRDQANEIVKQLLAGYEDSLPSAPQGLKFWECYDMKTLKPFKEHEELYARSRKELESYGVEFKF
jgi:methylamine--corrinoid protein Co-methyltransferase